MPSPVLALTIQLSELLKAHNLKLITIESCTGGGVAYALTSLPGSSTWFERGLVTYSNDAKKDLVGVSQNTLAKWGAVSEQTAYEMAEGGLSHSHADVSVAITGIAGPNGGMADKPVGLVWFAWAGKHFSTQTYQKIFTGDRQQIREQAIQISLEKLIETLKK